MTTSDVRPAPALEMSSVAVDGCAVSYRRLGAVDAPTVLLVHGGAAHSGWWSRVASILAPVHQVVLIDLSGHGDSGHRDDYGADQRAREIAAVLGRVTEDPAALVGHSMGGAVAAAAAARFPECVDALVLVDTRLPLRDLPRPSSRVRLFGSAQEALDRFRLQPDRTRADPALLRRLAAEGLRETIDGWRWRFDPAARRRLSDAGVSNDLRAVGCPIGYVYGEDSDMGGPVSHARLEEVLGRGVPLVVVPGSYHHIPLDQPGRCAAAIASLLGRTADR